ncbi:hypothetical protein BC827DRAFT_1239384, partial [Russula dissimulans]
MLASVVDSWDDAFEFSDEDGDPFACDWDEDSEESESPDSTSSSSSLGPVGSDSDESPPSGSPPGSSSSGSGSTTGSTRFPALGPASLPSSVRVNNLIRVFSSSVVEVTFRNTHRGPPSPEGDDSDSDSDDEETVSFPSCDFATPILTAFARSLKMTRTRKRKRREILMKTTRKMTRAILRQSALRPSGPRLLRPRVVPDCLRRQPGSTGRPAPLTRANTANFHYRAHVVVLSGWFRPTILVMPLQGSALHSIVQESSQNMASSLRRLSEWRGGVPNLL